MRIRLALIIAAFCTAIAANPLVAAPGLATAPEVDAVTAALTRNDFVEARRLSEELAAKGDAEGMNSLSILLEHGLGGPADPVRARQLSEQAVAAGSVAAKSTLARRLATSSDRTQWPRALTLLQDVSRDPKLAMTAYYPVGRIMVFYDQDPEHLRQGVVSLQEALRSEPNNADAQFLVGRAFQNGWGGTEKNPKEAFAHFLAAANLGHDMARRNVGMARLTGDGVAKDPVAAIADFKVAAADGNAWAMIDIAVMLATGEGVPTDPPQARAWYLKAAELGSAHGLRGVGVMLYRGEGGPIDLINGRAYLELAATAGDELSGRIAQALFLELAPHDREAVDAAKAAWLKSHPTPRAE
ncbi:MAG TPA: tetratricopeptide repeat protein [Phenylobacterium sp.]